MNFLAKKSPLDKYIADVKSYLPAKNRADILEELRANLSEKLADRAEETGIELSEQSEIEILSEFGHPLSVASEYQGEARSLLGPTLYPFYKMSVLVSLIISTCVLLVIMLSEVFFRVDLGDVSRPWIFVNTYIYIIGVITIGYVLAERLMERHNYLESWEPNALDQPDNALASAWGALIACIVAVTWLVILNLVSIEHNLQTLIGRSENPVHTLIFWMKIEMVILIPQYFYLVFNQTWSRNRLLLRIGSELILSVGCAVVLLGNAENLGLNYPDVPPLLASNFYVVLWVMLIVTLVSAYGYWRKLAKLEPGR
jgi:HAAS